MKSSWTQNLTPLYLGLTLVPLTLVGSLILTLSFIDLKNSSHAQQSAAIEKINTFSSQKVSHWKKAFKAATLMKENRDQMFELVPEWLSLKKLSLDGQVLFKWQRPGLLTTYQPPLDSPLFKSFLRDKSIWKGEAQFPEEGHPQLPLVLKANQNEIWVAEFDLNSVSQYLATFPYEIGLLENNTLVAHSSGRQFISQDSDTENAVYFELRGLGWQGYFYQPWHEAYRPWLILFIEIFIGIILVGFVTVGLGVWATQRAKKAISQKERLATIGQMASVVGHEVRTGLAVIKNSFGVLKGQLNGMDNGSKKHVEIVEGQIKETNKTLTDILHFGRNKKLNFEPVSLNSLAQEILDELAIPPAIKVIKNYSKQVSVVPLDRSEIKHALTNIILNAIQAMPEGGNLSVETMQKNNKVLVRVQDTGTGIQNMFKNKVFEPFFTTKSQGTGLGLSVVREVIESHGGIIKLTSQPGKGTHVELVIPMHQDTVIARSKATKQSQKSINEIASTSIEGSQ